MDTLPVVIVSAIGAFICAVLIVLLDLRDEKLKKRKGLI